METVKKETVEISKEQFGYLWVLHLKVQDLIKLDLNSEQLANLPEGWGAQLLKIVKTSAFIESTKF